MRTLLILLLLCTAAARASPPAVDYSRLVRDASRDMHGVLVQSDPAGAMVFDERGNFLGGPTPVTVRLNRYIDQNLYLKLDGYSASPIRTGYDALPQHATSPTPASERLAVMMSPTRVGTLLMFSARHHAAALAALLVGVSCSVGAIWWFLRRRIGNLRQEVVAATLESRGLVGQKVGDYEVVEELAEGAFSRVFRVRHLQYGDTYAMKVLKHEFLDDESQTRFFREMQLGRDVRHPNLVRVFAFGETHGSPYLVMELLAGRTLEDRLRTGPMEIAEALPIFRQVCLGVEAVHAQQVVHRDLKPANIMLCDDGNVRLMDFGIAKVLNQEKLTATGHCLGTPHYMSPEHLSSNRLAPVSDIYSLGIILYEMVCGRVPFEGVEPLTVISGHLSRRPAPPNTLNPAMAEDLSELILRMLEKSPQRRPASLQQVLEALDMQVACP